MQVILTVFSHKAICDDENKYCAYKRASKNSNVCWHDLGSPLMYFMENKWYVYGITSSFGVDSATHECNPYSPSYYTVVPNYLRWIAFNVEMFIEDEEFNQRYGSPEGYNQFTSMLRIKVAKVAVKSTPLKQQQQQQKQQPKRKQTKLEFIETTTKLQTVMNVSSSSMNSSMLENLNFEKSF